MNYAGKLDAKLSIDGSGLHSRGHAHVETITHHATHAPSDAIIVPDPQLLFNGEFKRSGVDLILSRDGHELLLHDYFKGEKRAPLASPDGAHLTGDLVDALTGHTQVAQADGSASVGKVIGHVTKLTGTATAVRNGVSIILHQGDNVEKGDVVQSGSDSTLGITFIDGTVFGLLSNARMVLNEMVYDPNGSNNSSLLSLVAGTITFVAGETAKHGDMKVDTPVATMGIRGTAVLVEIDFIIPGGQPGLYIPPGQLPDDLSQLLPELHLQVLVEPDGTTGSFFAFEKGTLTKIAEINQAGQQINISQGVVTVTNATLPPDIQKLITDVFSLRFTDNSNPKTFDHQFTDTVVPQSLLPIQLADGTTAIPVVLLVKTASAASPSGPGGPTDTLSHIPGPPQAVAFGNSLTELVGKTGDVADVDTVSGKVNYVDINAGDVPTVKTAFTSFAYQDAQHNDVTATLNAQQLADIKAIEVKLIVVQDPAGKNTGSATWTYNIPDNASDFLAVGEKVILTYTAEVDNNFAPNNEAAFVPFTITITGTNDVPVITTGPQNISFAGGKTTPGGPLTTTDPTSGTLSFADVDLTDTHTVSTKLTSALLNGADIASLAPAPLKIFETALSASIATGNDSTGTGAGTVDWQLADLPAYLADFVPAGQTLTLTYTVTVTDSQATTSTQIVTVAITGTDTPAVVWIATTTSGSTGDWNDPSNWETGTVPTAVDDAIIITDQLQNLTPYYPVTIDAPAFANSLIMNDFGADAPELDNNSDLTIGGGLGLSADAIVKNFGNISLGGLAEILNQSSLQNSGFIALGQGGDFKDQSSVTNSGTIEVAGGTLNIQVDVANAGGHLNVDGTAKVTLNGAAIDSGTVTNNGEIDLTGAAVLKNGSLGNSGQINVSGTGNALQNENITANHAIEVLVGGALLLDQGTTVANAGGTVTVDGTATLTLNDATITGGTVTDSGTIHVTGDSAIDSASVNGGQLTVDATRTLTLDDTTVTGTTVTDNGTIKVDAGKTLNLSGVALTGGAIDNLGTVDITGDSSINNDALSNTQLTVDGTATLTLNGTTITGGTVTDSGTIHVTGGSAIDSASVNGGQLTVDATRTLTLDDTTVTGTTVTDNGTIKVDAGKTLNLSGVALTGGAIDNLGIVAITGDSSINNDALSNTQLTVDATATLTLNGTTITGGTVTDSGTIHVTGDSAIDSASVNGGQLMVDAARTLTLDDTTVTGTTITGADISSIVHTDNGQTLTLNGATVSGGSLANDGTIDSTGISAITDVGITNTGLIEATNGVLTIDPAGGVTISNSGTLEANGGELDIINEPVTNTGTLQAINDSTLKLTSTVVTNAGGAVTVASGSTLDLIGATINGGTLGNGGIMDVSGTGNALEFVTVTNNGTIEILAASALKITGSISGGGSVVIDAGATLELGATDTQTVSFSGDSGELQLDASSFGGQIQGLAATDKLDLQNIAYGANTTATYVGGVLIVTDGIGDSVSLTLVGDYSAAHFAGSDDGLGHTLITLTAADDAPVVADKTAAASVAELAATTGLSTLDLSSPVGGTIHFTDVDLTDRPTATVTAQAFTWLAADGHTDLTSSLTPTEMAQLGAALALIQAGNTNNGAIGWTYSITDSVLDFIGAGEAVTVVSTLTLNDHQGGTDTATVTVTINGADDAPLVLDDSNSITAGDAPVSGNLLANDSDVEHQTLSVSNINGENPAAWVADGIYGELVVDSVTGNYTYTLGVTSAQAAAVSSLGQGFIQQDQFTYTASDGMLGTDAHLTIDVTGTNGSLVAHNDTIASGFLEDTATTLTTAQLLGNDFDVVGTPNVTSVGDLNGHSLHGGTVSLNGNLITYAPAADYNGPDSFTYTISDGGFTSTAVVSFNVAAVDDAPVATAVALAAGTEDTAYTINAATLLAGVTDLDGPSLSITSVSVASGGGSVVNNGDGTFTYTPAANYNGPVSFNYTASDGTLSSSSTASLTLAAVDDAPVATAVALAAGTEDTAYTINAATLLAGVTDLDGPSLSITSVSVASGGGSVVNNGDGTFTYTPAANYNGPVSFNYTASDGTLSSSSTASLTLAAVDDAPVATAVTLAAGTEDTAYTINAATLLAGVTDLDGPSLSITSVSVASGGGSVVNNGDGTFTYTPAANYNGPVSFNYTASDGTLSSSSTASLTLAAVDDAPVATAVTLAAGTEDTAYTINAATLLAGVTDLDGPSLSITSVSVASGGGSVVNNGDGTFTYTPAANYNGPVSFNYTASDGTLSSSSTASLTLAAVDDAPVATAVTLAAGTEDTAYTINAATLLAGVTDLDGPSLSITSVSVASGGGSVVNNGDGTFTYTPAANYNGPVSFNYTASDGTLSSSSTASLTLAAVDDAPVATAVTLAAGTEDTAYTINAATLLAGVTDLDGPSLSITSVSVASGGGSVVNNGDGTFTYTPAANYNGPVSFNYTASDGTLSSSSTASLTLAAVDDAPVATAVTLAAGTEDTAYTINAATLLAGVTDLDGPSLSITSVSVASGGGSVVNNGDGTFTYTPAANYNGPVSFNYTASDGTLSSSSTASLALAAVNDAPVITAASLTVAEGGTVLVTPANIGVTDPDSSSFTFTVTNVSHGTFQTTTDGVTWVDATTFTSIDLAANHVRFVQDGSATAPTFSIQADDGAAANHLGNVLAGTITFVPVAGAILGDAGDNTLIGTPGNDVFQGFGGNDTIIGLTGVDRAIYTDAAGGITVNLGAGTASGAGVGTDTLVAIEGVVGSDFADTFNAAGFAGAAGTPGTPVGFNEFEGRGGNDTVISAVNEFGAALTRVSYVSATAGVTVDIAAGTADGDGSVGHDTFVGSGILSIWGSSFADTLYGSNNGFGTIEVFAGFAGNDLIDGRGGFDRADYNNDLTTTSGITVNLAAGTVTGDATVGTDTLVSVEAVRGTNLADTYNAVGFSGTSTNAGSLGTFNEFTGQGGNDIIIGNGNTRLGFNNATAGVVVDIAAGTATGDSSVGSDTFTGVNAIMGSMFADSLSGSVGSETFTGLGGDDFIDGLGGFDTVSYNNIYLSTGGVSVNMAAGIATGDATIGTDTLRSIEGIQGTMLADTYDATGYGVVGALNVSSSNGNFNQFEGLGGDDQITGNGNTRVIYSNSADGVIITIGAGGSGSAHGTAAGDAANVGNDSFTGGVNSAIGGNFADSYNASSFTGFNSFQGNAGNDTITGNSSTQIQYGNATAGVVVDLAAGAADGDGSVGHDTFTGVNSVLGSNLNDTLLGSSGNDFLNGSGGNDMINGRGGNDNLTGGGGADTFVYQIGGGADFIVDFNHGQGDRIDVTGVAGVFSLADIQAHASQQGSNTVIDFGSGNTITLQNLTLANLMASDFVFNNSVTGTSGADVLVGTAQVDGIFGLAGNDRLQGLAGDDWLDGGLGFDRATYTDATGPVTVNLAAATATGAGVGTDTLVNIEAAAGSNFADTFDATGFTGVNGNPGGSAGSNAFEGMGGNDLIIGYINAQGQALTRVDYLSASDAVTVDIAAGTAHGTNAGDLANVGTDSFSHVATVFGSAFNDTLLGSNNAAFTYESYEGRGGDDFINGRGGYDTVTYNNDPTTTSGIIVHLADGIVTGDATVGTDTLQGVEAARGTNFDDVFDATGFGLAGATNVGSSGTFNDFGGMGGNDTIIGNGNTRLNYQVAAASVTVDLETSPIGTTTAITVAGSATGTTEGTDTFTGVNAVQGSTFADTLLGSSFNNTFTGLAGDDYIDGRGGFDTASFNSLGTATSGVSVNMAAGIATGDATIGTDTLRSIEGIQGTMLADTYDATGYGVVGALNVSSSNGNFNQFEGLGGDDQITGNGNTRVIYSNSADGVIITIGAGGSGSAHGTAAGDAANVGNDSFTGGVNSAIGGNFADSYNASSFTGFNSFQGNAGNDTITGNSSTQIQYGNATSAVTITIGAGGNGTATGDASVGTDSFTGVNSAVGSNFADSYNASGFTGFNSFQGLAGDDTITGNGSTQLGYYSATSGLTVDLQAGTAAGDASVGHDTFTGVNSVAGSNSGDTLYGNGGFNILYGGGGNDVLDGRGGGDFLSGGAGADTFVYAMGGGPAAISDFDRGNSGIFNQAEGDKIDLTGVPGIYNLGDIQAIASSPNGADTLIDFGNGDTLILTGVLPSDLVASDFVFALGTSTTFETEVFPNPFGGSSSSLPGTLDGGTANVSVVGISTDGINFVPVTAGSGATVQGTYFNFAVNYSGSESLNVGVPAYQDANALIAAIEANENGAAPLSDTFYYQVQDQFGNDTIDKVTYTLSDLTFTGTGPLALAAIDGVPISLGSLQVHDWGVAAGFGSSPLSVTVTVGSGTLSLASAPVQYSTATFSGDGHSVTITGDEFQVDADLANLQFTGSAAGRTDITISGIDGPSHTATYLVGSIAVDDQAPSITGDLAIVTVKGSGVQLTGLATAVTTADLQAVDLDNTPDQLTFTVTGTSHGHLANSATGSAIASFTQAQLNSGSVFFVTDDSSYVGSGSFSVSLSDGVLGAATPAMRVGVTIVDAQFSVLTADGYNFDQDNSIGAMGSGNIVPDAQHSGTTFEIVNAGANRDFIVVGNGFAYDPGTHALTAGTITSILETTDDASHQPLASFGLYVPAVDWMNAVIAVANGDQSLIEALVSPWTFNFIGNAGADAFGAANLNDIFTGRAGTDTLDGQFGYDRANYGAATGPINVQLAAGIVTGDASTGTDTLKSIEMVTGSNDADTFDATGFGATSTNAGSTVTNNVAGTFNEFEGRGGVDLITGNGATRVSYYHATSGVTVTFDGNSWNPAFNPNGGASGTATGDASVGTDHFTGVTQVRGSFFGDTFTGSNNPFGTAENFEGLGGNDNINGGGGFDRAQYFQASDGVGITVQLANGIVTGGPDTGTDTLTSIEGIYGTDFADIYDATGFTGSGAATPSANSGNSGSGGTSSSFNEFEGGAGNDTVTGNGNTRVAYYHATGGVVVTLGSSGSGDSFGNSSVGHDHFNGSVNAVRGSEFNDIITGNGGNNTLEGLNGNDVLDGKGGNDTLTGGTGADIVVFKVGVVDSVNSPSNNDTITDFSHFDGDRIDLRAIPSIQSLSDVFSHATQVGSNTVIDFSYLNPTDPTSLTLLNVTMVNLTASDFIFASSLGPSVSVTVQTPDGYDFSMLYDDLTASNPLQSANDSNHIFAVDAAKGITFELIGGGIYDTSTHQWTSGLISEIDILNTTDPTQTTQDHVLVNTNGWTISASDLFAAIGGYAGNGNASLLNGIFNSATYSIVGTAGFADNNSKSHDGADVFFGGDHADIFNGLAGPFGQFDPGNDTVDYSHAAAGVTADLFQSANNTGAAAGDIYISIENLRGTAFNDTLTGDGMNNVLEGGPGHNALNGGGGWNTASYEHAATGVTVDLAVTGTEQTVAAGMFDTLTNIQNVRGSSHDDTLTGNGSSMLEGGPGNDHLIGQPGQSDTASYEHATSGVTVNLAVAGQQDTQGAGLDTLTNIANLTGSQYNDTLTGDTHSNILFGNGGNDTFVFNENAGGIGQDTIGDFMSGQDHIQLDYAAFDPSNASSFSLWLANHVATVNNGSDLLIDLNPDGSHPGQDTILLKNASFGGLHASDFILPNHP